MSGLQESQTCADALNAIPTIGIEKRKPKTKLCECGCGNFAPISKKNSKEYGWIKGKPIRYILGHNGKKHGLYGTRIYKMWENMIHRCHYPKSISYENYGGRGIFVCDEWRNKNGLEKFAEFIFSIGWDEGCNLEIDRIDNDKGYFCKNIRLVSASINRHNTRRLRRNNNSGYRGVNSQKGTRKYRATITINNNCIHIGYFQTPEEAAAARDKYILKNNIKGPHLQVLNKGQL